MSIHYKALINCIPTLAPVIHHIYAQIALEEKAKKNLAYASVHDKTPTANMEVDLFNSDFTSPSMDLIRSGAKPDHDDTSIKSNDMQGSKKDLSN